MKKLSALALATLEKNLPEDKFTDVEFELDDGRIQRVIRPDHYVLIISHSQGTNKDLKVYRRIIGKNHQLIPMSMAAIKGVDAAIGSSTSLPLPRRRMLHSDAASPPPPLSLPPMIQAPRRRPRRRPK